MSEPLGNVVRDLLKERGMKAFELGEKCGLSATSISKIVNGVTRPRQNNFTQMCQVLCRSRKEEARLVSAFTGQEFLSEEPDGGEREPEKEILRLRAQQYLERKTQSLAFKRTVERELEKSEIAYKKNYAEGMFCTDFMIESGEKRIGIECQVNWQRDPERTWACAELVKEKLKCSRVLIVVPYAGAEDDEAQGPGRSAIRVVALQELREVLKPLKRERKVVSVPEIPNRVIGP